MSDIVFGPVTSRRFGQSLGIDLSPDKKQCNFDCLYCELKGAKTVASMQDAPSVTKVIAEVKKALIKYQNIDVITLTANGEPSLYPYISELVQELNKVKNNAKILILSNGSTIGDKNIQKVLQDIDIVKLSLDCATQKCFKKLDRPLKSINIKDIIEGMVHFAKDFSNELVIEVLVVKNINDTKDEFFEIKKVLDLIKPHRIDVGSIDRPPAYNVQGVEIAVLKELALILEPLPVSIAYKKDYSEIKRDFSESEIINLVSKRPQSFDDVRISFSDSSKVILETLLEKEVLHVKEIAGVNFYELQEA
jgi:wyosine [tRNA(Phe)-imidazoG37] synthetase (radical SAM superfamily)